MHVLYHRWQVDGRKESPAPYWITSCEDGEGSSYYNFGNRKQKGLHKYFENSLRALVAIRKVMRYGGYLVQLVAFRDPNQYLPKYLKTLEKAGFKELFILSPHINGTSCRVWRQVPNRKWHAVLRDQTTSLREVFLIHKAL